MIRALGEADGKLVLIVGLSEIDLAKLAKGQPVQIDGAKWNRPDVPDVFIYAGKNDAKLAHAMASLVNESTIVHRGGV